MEHVGQTRLNESYTGVVQQVSNNQIVIAYETENDIVEHTYQRSQFIESHAPQKGDKVKVFVRLVVLSPEDTDDKDEIKAMLQDAAHRRRKRVLTEPHEF